MAVSLTIAEFAEGTQAGTDITGVIIKTRYDAIVAYVRRACS